MMFTTKEKNLILKTPVGIFNMEMHENENENERLDLIFPRHKTFLGLKFL